MNAPKNIVTSFAEISHLHSRINILSNALGLLAQTFSDNSDEPTRVRLKAIMAQTNQQLTQSGNHFNRDRLLGHSLVGGMRKLMGDEIEPVALYDMPVDGERILEWNNFILTHGSGQVITQPEVDSPFAVAKANKVFDELEHTRYEDTQSGVYEQWRDGHVGYVTILRINEKLDDNSLQLRHFLVIPFGSGTYDIHTYSATEGVWIAHTDAHTITDEQVRDSVFALLNGESAVTPPMVDLTTVAQTLIKALEDREDGLPSPYITTVSVQGSDVIQSIWYETARYQASLQRTEVEGVATYEMELESPFHYVWPELHPLMQQQVIRDMLAEIRRVYTADEIFAIEEAVRLQEIEDNGPVAETVAVDAEAASAALSAAPAVAEGIEHADQT